MSSPLFFPTLGDMLVLLPARHPVTPIDYLVVPACQTLVILALVPPLTPAIYPIRLAVVLPLVATGFFYWCFCLEHNDNFLAWGTCMLGGQLLLQAVDKLACFPPEKYAYRMIPKIEKRVEIDDPNSQLSQYENIHAELVPEPVPAGWTWTKCLWAASLVTSFRGLGWNYAAPLPNSARRHPFLRSSSRWAWFKTESVYWISSLLLFDLVRSFMNCSPVARAFFSGATPTYDQLPFSRKVIYTICVGYRVWWQINPFHLTMLIVGIGGLFNLRGHVWEPWGWAPVCGRLSDVWEHPGLANMWSRIWHQSFRRFLYDLAWVGVGENLLGLPESGPRPQDVLVMQHRRPTRSRENGYAARPAANGVPLKTSSQRMLLINYLKSTLVFGLCGLLHDFAFAAILPSVTMKPVSALRWQDASHVTPFFLVQPIALAVEVMVKHAWTRMKKAQYTTSPAPPWITTAEKFIAIGATIAFLGWSARVWVVALLKAGLFRRDAGQSLHPSLFGGLVWGQWNH